jgi:hypothetical protein
MIKSDLFSSVGYQLANWYSVSSLTSFIKAHQQVVTHPHSVGPAL